MYGKRIKYIVSLVLVMVMMLSISVDVFAYDFDAPHPDINSSIDVDKTKEVLWHTMRSWGLSEAATSAFMGNFYGECGYNYTRAEDRMGSDMRNFILGEHGIGLIMWTYWSIQEELFAVCDEMGVQWTNLDAQLVALKDLIWASNWWSYGGSYNSLEEFMNTTDVILATDVVCWGFERPYAPVAHLDRRRAEAQAVYEKFTGTPVDNSMIMGSGESGEGSNSTEGGITSAELIISEWDLLGMPSSKGILSEASKVRLPNYNDLGVSEAYSVNLIKDNILTEKSFNLFDTVRVVVVFLGLVVIFYSLLLLIAYLFDRTNNLFDLSLISIISFGTLKYCDGIDYEGRKGYVDSTRIIKVSVLCIIVGLFLVSGGVFLFVSRFLYWLLGVL